MAFPSFGKRFRVPQPSDHRARPRTCKARDHKQMIVPGTSQRSKTQPRKLSHRKSVSLPFLTPRVVVSDTDDDSDPSYTDRYGNSVTPRASTRKSSCSRLPAIDKDSHLHARSSRQLVINQQKLMFKYQNLEHQFQKLKEKAALIKRELDRIRVMKTPEPEPFPQAQRRPLNLWTTDLENSISESVSPRPSLTSEAGAGSRLTSPHSVHLGSSCMFRSDDWSPCSSRSSTSHDSSPDSSAPLHLPSLSPSSYPPPSPSTSLSGNSSFLYSDTEDEEAL